MYNCRAYQKNIKPAYKTDNLVNQEIPITRNFLMKWNIVYSRFMFNIAFYSDYKNLALFCKIHDPD